MNLRTFWFNIGIFKNTIKRFKWGSVLYFVILFLSVPFAFLVRDVNYLVGRFVNITYKSDVLFRGDLLVIPLLLSMAVPTVAAVLIFRFVHSDKQGTFVHGLPLKREENYISSVIAGLCLMIAPVLLNGIILGVMSLTKYGMVITFASVIYWVLTQCAILFIMMSIASATAFLTGNSAAHIGINIIVHLLPLIAALAIYLISEVFLFGFVQNENFIATKILENTPVVWLFASPIQSGGHIINIFTEPQMWIYIIGAVLVYVLGYILYKHRKIELAGDVAAFKCFKPIFKYTVSAVSVILSFAVLNSMDISGIYKFIFTSIIAFVVYFALEMLINKTVKVFKYYKGFVGFVAFCGLFIAFFAYSNVFGYETRVPVKEQIESATIYSGWFENIPFVEDEALIENVIEVHNEILKDIPVTTEKNRAYEKAIKVEYKLTDGKILKRYYTVSDMLYNEAMDKLYQSKEYKIKINELDNIIIENVSFLEISINKAEYNHSIKVTENASELLKAIYEDVENISYKQIKNYSCMDINISFDITAKDNKIQNVFKNFPYPEEGGEYVYKNFHITINSEFENTMKFLKENGYYETLKNQLASNLYICKKPINVEKEVIEFKGDVGIEKEFVVSSSDCVAIDLTHGYQLCDLMFNTSRTEAKDGENYYIFARNRGNNGDFMMYMSVITFARNELPEYLLSYIE